MPSPRVSGRPRRSPSGGRLPLSAQVLAELDLHGSLSGLEARLGSLEIDLVRVSGELDEDTRRSAGEMALMRARLDDALTAISETARELREAWTALERRILQSPAPNGSGVSPGSAVARKKGNGSRRTNGAASPGSGPRAGDP